MYPPCQQGHQRMETTNTNQSVLTSSVSVGATVKIGDVDVEIVHNEVTLRNIIKKNISAPGREGVDEPFFVVDLGEVLLQHQKWKSLLPRVKPFYAVKSNDDPAMIHLLNQLGTGFDCASKGEIKLAISCGVHPSKIVYANPYKQASHIQYARQQNVSLTVFNDEEELHKIKRLYPTTRLLLRIRPDHGLTFPHNKFGAQAEKAGVLLKAARDMNLEVVGVSFHTGWHARDDPNNIYDTAVKLAKSVFDLAPQYGHNFNLLDVGGGYHAVPSRGMSFEEQSALLSAALDQYFPSSAGVQIIAEPGQFYATLPYTLAACIMCKRITEETSGDSQGIMYHIAEGTFQTFDHAHRFRDTPPWNTPNVFEQLDPRPIITANRPSVIWGRSCAAYDWVEKYPMQEMECGDWVIVKEKGDYTSCVTSNFNGFPKAVLYHFMRESHWEMLGQMAARIADVSG